MAKKIADGTPTEAIATKELTKINTDSDELDTDNELEEEDFDTTDTADDIEYQDTTDEDDTGEDDTDTDYLEVDFLQEKKRLTKEEAKQYAQMGLNYKHVKEKADKADAYEKELQELRLKIAEADVLKQKDDLRKSLEDEGYDSNVVEKIITQHPAFIQVQKMLESSQAESKKAQILRMRAVEKEALKDQPYFAELEPELDKMAQAKGYENVAMDTMYNLMLGETIRKGKLNELISKAKKSAVADMQDSSKRRKVLHSDAGTGEESIDAETILSKKGMELARVFKVDPKKIASYVKRELKK